jgi:ketosteroid isomerase-like protein
MEDQILSMEKAAMERWRNGDPMGFLELCSPAICYTDPGQVKPIIGLNDYSVFMKGLIGQIHYHKSEFSEPKVVMVGEAALLSYNYRSTVLTAEGKVDSQTPWNCTEVYFKEGGAWRIVHNHWSFIHQKMLEKVDIPVPAGSQGVVYTGLTGELMSLEAAAMARWDKGDPWGFIELSAPDVTYFDTGTPKRINGREALSAEYKQREGKISYEVMDFIEPWALAKDDLAVLFYRFFSTRLNADGSVASRVPWNCSEVFQRMPEGWKIIHTHWSFICGERS